MCHILRALAVMLLASSLWGQTRLVIDRSPSADDPVLRLGKTKEKGFVGDHFQIGRVGEVWIIDQVRMWVLADNGTNSSANLEDVFRQVSLYGGIEGPELKTEALAQPDCDCHNLVKIKSVDNSVPTKSSLQPIRDNSHEPWQPIEFQKLQWSVPGGVPIQFGAMGTSGMDAYTLYIRGSNVGGVHTLRSFDEKGKLEGPYETDDAALDDLEGVNIQVWAHKMARVEIRPRGHLSEVLLFSDRSVDAANVDSLSLRFGPRKTTPISSHMKTVDGRAVWKVQFVTENAGVNPSTVNACLTGKEKDGTPFEGCDSMHRN